MTDNTPSPLRVAIIGSGPSGFYAAEHLLKQTVPAFEVDMFDRLPTPFGLVRGGVAPDHPKIKTVVKAYDKTALDPRFRFFGHVEFGKDVKRDELAKMYHAILYAVGAQSDRRMNIPGEDLPGSHPATEFVAWYNAHPDYRHLTFDLTQETAVVVGVGNVAMDVARILARSISELKDTDIADYALEALAKSKVKRIYVLGRRGPVQAAFTSPEIKEMGEMEEADVLIDPADLALDPISQALLDSGTDKEALKNMDHLRHYAGIQPSGKPGKPKQILFKFLTSPVEISGNGRVQNLKIVRNKLVEDGRGGLKAVATDQSEILNAGLIFRSVGYRGTALPGVPFHEDWGTIPHDHGRVLTAIEGGQPVIGNYVVGWIKRGPSGIIGTNKPDSVETVDRLIEDAQAGKLLRPDTPGRESIEELLKKRKVRFVTYADWQTLDRLELERGAKADRPRLKFSSVEEMLAALG
jgi:ferredoxin--NADP+ reductase